MGGRSDRASFLGSALRGTDERRRWTVRDIRPCARCRGRHRTSRPNTAQRPKSELSRFHLRNAARNGVRCVGRLLACRRVTRVGLICRASPSRPNSNHDIEGNIAAVAGSSTLRFRDRACLPCLATLALTIENTGYANDKRRRLKRVLARISRSAVDTEKSGTKEGRTSANGEERVGGSAPGPLGSRAYWHKAPLGQQSSN